MSQTVVQKIAAAAALAFALLLGALGLSSEPAMAGEPCEGCIEIVDDIDCGSPFAHNWKLCDGTYAISDNFFADQAPRSLR